MTFYAKLINRPLAFEGWFEKPKNRLFGHVRVNHDGSVLKMQIYIYIYGTDVRASVGGRYDPR